MILRRFALAGVTILAAVAAAWAQSPAPYTPRTIDVTNTPERDRIVGALQHGLSRVGAGGQIQRCPLVVESPPTASRDASYGAACMVIRGNLQLRTLMCGDWALGRFGMTQAYGASREDVDRFVLGTCPARE